MAVLPHRRGRVAVALVALMMMVVAVGLASADFASYGKMCADKLAVLATCLPFVEATATATARAPRPDCCSALREVLGDSKKCPCVLIKDRDDPAIGIKANVSRAMDLPSACSIHAVRSDCPELLHISPDSKEAEIFKQYEIHEGKHATAGTASGKSADAVSGEGTHTAVVFTVVVSALLAYLFVLA